MEKWIEYLKADRKRNPKYYTSIELEAKRIKHLYNLFIAMGN